MMISKRELIQEVETLENSIMEVSAELEMLKNTIEEPVKLRAVRCGNGYQYFLRRKGSETNGEYIKAGEINKAIMLAQLEYDERLLKALRESKKTFQKCEPVSIVNPFETVLEVMSPGKRRLVNPHYVSDDSYLMNWLTQEYESISFKEDSPEYYTRRGLRVRSKSEVIIADILDEMSIPYLYEKPLRLMKKTVHPDFTLLNIKERKEVYWEHFGMMDDREYRDDAFMKIREYEASGFYQYDSVIWTFESGKNPMSIKVVRNMIRTLRNSLGY